MPVDDQRQIYDAGSNAKNYASSRPQWPKIVYDKILSYLDEESSDEVARRILAVDVGCGSGQSTIPLAEHFRSVVGIDISEAQLNEARILSAPHKNITYTLGAAEQLSSFGDGSVDLVTSGIALHFFDLEKFFSECNRVLKVGGVFAAYSCQPGNWENEHANQLFNELLLWKTMKNYWIPQTLHAVSKYEGLYSIMKHFFKDSVRDDLGEIKLNFSLEDLIGYIKTFPAYCAYKEDHPEHPDDVDVLLEKLMDVFGTTATTKKLLSGSTPVTVIMGRKI